MRSNRSISLPLSFLITCCVWFAFLWTMQHAPVSRRPATGDDFSGARSSGGLANNFASAVVRFFDDQDPREVDDSRSLPEPILDSEMVEYLPLPQENRAELAKDLPEVFDNLSLTARNLFRSDVDLDADNDLDLALLVRVSKTEALGAVLEYVGDNHFRFAGKFPCEYQRAEDFGNCFKVVRTGGGAMHILSHTMDLIPTPRAAGAGARNAESHTTPEPPPIPGWRWMRLEEGRVIERGSLEDPGCSGTGEDGVLSVVPEVEPVPETNEDVFRFLSSCKGEQACVAYRFDANTRKYERLGAAGAAYCPNAGASR